MDTLTVVLIVALVILALSLLLYLVGFRWKKLTFISPFGTAELEREPAGAEKPAAKPAPATTVEQKAAGGGVIQDSPIEAPAGSGAQVSQEATDKGRIEGSGITLE
jgi:hypothetical protein